jgi:hypothetical protein
VLNFTHLALNRTLAWLRMDNEAEAASVQAKKAGLNRDADDHDNVLADNDPTDQSHKLELMIDVQQSPQYFPNVMLDSAAEVIHISADSNYAALVGIAWFRRYIFSYTT